MPTPLGIELVEFAVGAVASLGASHLLTSRIERLGARVVLSEALLGLVTALAADSPEITSSISAIGSGRQTVGIGVVLGSNVFNIAALLGLGALAAGGIHLHRRVVALEGTVAVVVAAVAIAVAGGVLAPAVALAISLAALLDYGLVLGLGSERLRRLPIPPTLTAFLDEAACDECLEVGPPEAPPPGTPAWRDGLLGSLALLLVIGASILMERAGVGIGGHLRLAPIVTGGIVLAAVTSLPNAVAAVYLARRGRGAAVLSEAMNSNALNVAVGLLVPGVLIGMGPLRPQAVSVAGWYGGLTVAALLVAFVGRRISRVAGAAIIAAYLVFVVTVLV